MAKRRLDKTRRLVGRALGGAAKTLGFMLEYEGAMNRLEQRIEDEIDRGSTRFDLEVDPEKFSSLDDPDPEQTRQTLLRVRKALVDQYPITCVDLSPLSEGGKATMRFEVHQDRESSTAVES